MPTIRRLFIAACFALLAVSAIPAFAQETKPAAPAEEKATEHSKSLMDHIKEGGLIMIPIGLCSLATFWLVGDGFMRTSVKRAMPEQHVNAIKNHFRSGDYQEAYRYAAANPSAFTNVARSAIGMLGEGKEAVEEAVAVELSKESSKMQTWISYLSVIGVCTPMIGLIGTVFGMISAFAVLGRSGIGDPSKLSAAIGEVLVATASGLLIAVPAFFFYYVLRNRAAQSLHDIHDTIATLFRRMPYHQLSGAHIGDEELYAAAPNWNQQ